MATSIQWIQSDSQKIFAEGLTLPSTYTILHSIEKGDNMQKRKGKQPMLLIERLSDGVRAAIFENEWPFYRQIGWKLVGNLYA